MTRWEYKVVELSTEQIENQLNFLGEEGWELIQMEKTGDEVTAIFKRLCASGWLG